MIGGDRMVEVQKCSWLEFSAHREFPALLDEYASESATEGLPTPKADENLYLTLERSGAMHVLIAKVEDALVGFLVLLVSRNPHYSTKLAIAESFFVAADRRKTGAGRALIAAAKRLGRDLGAAGFFVSAPLGGKLAKVLERDRSCRESNRVFFWSLADG